MAEGATSFGNFARDRRLKLGLSLRGFCRTHGLDWSYVSKVERGLLDPPKSRSAQERYARALDLVDGTDDWQTFLDLAAISGGRIPDHLLRDKELVAKLPLVFRTLAGRKLSPERLRALSDIISEA